MRLVDGRLSVSPTDLANFLACRHRTALELGEARGKRTRPQWSDPLLEILWKRGLEHERGYVAALESTHQPVVDLADVRDRDEAIARTLDTMRAGVDIIIQAALSDGRWYGRPDVLLKVDVHEKPSIFGAWAYEVADTKLARETRGGTILQLGLYCHLLELAQGLPPAEFHVVTPDAGGRRVRSYRVAEYAAYFRLLKRRLEEAGEFDDEAMAAANYPEPVDHCDVCPWLPICRQKRRRDDHLSLVAGISRVQRRELGEHGITTLTQLGSGGLPSGFKPQRGALETYGRVQAQARVQVESKGKTTPVVESLLPTKPDPQKKADDPYQYPADIGLSRLPEPSPGDLFLDLEGDPFAGEPSTTPDIAGGREYLFGLIDLDENGHPLYHASWAETEHAERQAFEAVIDRIMQARDAHPGMHVFHYAPYEPSAFKRLAGRYATRGQDIDKLLRAGIFVDLYGVVRQGVLAGVERYSIKNLEVFYGFTREVSLVDANRGLRAIEQALELGRADGIAREVRDAVQGYNRDDCLSTLCLRNWLEARRAALEAQGTPVPRPVPQEGEASEDLKGWEQRIAALRGELIAGIPENDAERTDPQRARRHVAYLLDWHRRESKADWWEYFRLRELPERDLMDEPRAVAGLVFVADIERDKRRFVQRYRYPMQELEIRRGDDLKTQDGKTFAEVRTIDRCGQMIDVLVGPSKAANRPTALFAHKHVKATVIEDAIFAMGEALRDGTLDPVAHALLRRTPPRLRSGTFNPPKLESGASQVDYAVAIVNDLDATVLPIQGPPGSGKTFTGARMICALLDAGKRVGITANSHAVISNLFDAVEKEAKNTGTVLRMIHKRKADEDDDHGAVESVEQVSDNEDVAARLESGRANLAGGTAWLWADARLKKAVDVLFVDEAGQMSLANALAVTQAAGSLVLLGDPQQLEQPQKGSHPDGVGVSALQHILGREKTMPEGLGLFLPVTWRLAPGICKFTSEVFYERKLKSKPGLENQRLIGTGRFDGSGLRVVEVEHDGNRNASDQEVDVVASIVDALLAPGSQWSDEKGGVHRLTPKDVRIVAPYNGQVSRLQEKLDHSGVPIGTVDKFQGQEAPVVIYSMATSRPEDAPRGMPFLYSLNRLNVATSRAKCVCILVASPRLFEPECHTPHQMRLANALCRYREMAE